MNTLETETTYAFLILPGFPMSCLTSAIEPLRATNEIIGRKAFRWMVVSEDGQSVRSSAEVRFDPDVSLSALPNCNGLYLLSGPNSKFTKERTSQDAIRRLARGGVTVGAFSGGVFPLAKCGLLSGKKCSVHWVYETAFRDQFPRVIATDKVIVRDGKFETVSGSAAVFDLMLGRIERRLGPEIMTEVACWFQHSNVRGEDAAQRVPAHRLDRTQDMLPTLVAEAIKLFASHIEEPVTVAYVAQAMGLSTRQLNRSFQTATGQSPLRYYRMLRMEKARQLVLYSGNGFTDIAIAVGYSADVFARHYKQAFGTTPSDHRKQANQFRSD